MKQWENKKNMHISPSLLVSVAFNEKTKPQALNKRPASKRNYQCIFRRAKSSSSTVTKYVPSHSNPPRLSVSAVINEKADAQFLKKKSCI